MTCSAASDVNGRMGSPFPHLVAVVPGLKLRGLLETPRFPKHAFFYYISMLDNVKKGALFSS
jgi:hypothetical protein